MSSNTFHLTPEKGDPVNILIVEDDKKVALSVSDDGVGTSEDLDIEQTDTMGLHLVKVLAGHQLDGQIELTRSEGTQFKIKFKRAAYKPRI